MTRRDKTVQCIDNTGAKGEYHLLDKGTWREIRKEQKDLKGKPYVVTDACVIRLPEFTKHKELRIYCSTEDSEDVKELSEETIEELAKRFEVPYRKYDEFREWVKLILE